MDALMGFTILLIFWLLVYILDVFLKFNKYTHDRYILWTINSGVTFGLLRIKWFTKSFNRFFLSAGNSPWFPWTAWFTCGIYFSLLALCFGMAFLTLLVINTISQRVVEHEVLTPVMPGINVPFHHLIFVIFTIVIVAVVHEFGHAIAAIKEGVRVDGFGFIFFILYPGAFTDINTVDLEGLDPKRKLRIFSAGNWHNFVALLTGFCLLQLMPYLLFPFYSTNNGVFVSYISQNSVLTGKLGLYYGDVITKVNNCPVQNQVDWFDCMQKIQLQIIKRSSSSSSSSSSQTPMEYSQQQNIIHQGYCLPVGRVRQLDISAGYKVRTVWGNIECCSNQSRSHLCFQFTSNYRFSGQVFNGPRYACLPVRTVTSRIPCTLNVHCLPPNQLLPGGGTASPVCLIPSLENSTRLVRIVHSRQSPVLFLGSVTDLLRTVGVSKYIPRWNLFPSALPTLIETLLLYLIALSGALILFNSVPCYSLDGQWIVQAAIDILFSNIYPNKRTRDRICSTVTFYGTVLIATNVSLSIYFMIHQT